MVSVVGGAAEPGGNGIGSLNESSLHRDVKAWYAQPGDLLEARIREHRGFRIEDNAHRPWILIGNGTGIAGLRALLKAREAAGVTSSEVNTTNAARAATRATGAANTAMGRAGETTAANAAGATTGVANIAGAATRDVRCWLLFGERSARHDAFYAADIDRWRRSGLLTHCDLVYSRDQAERRYVQHRLAECRDELRAWIDAGAAIYVCGSLEGMAGAVDAVLEETLGRVQLDLLTRSGRYRRDVY